MQEYRRRIAYLYAYEHGFRTRSFGFVKMESRGEICRLWIHLKSRRHPGEETGKAYIYFYHKSRIVGIFLGALKEQGGALLWEGAVDSGNVLEKGIPVSGTEGIWVQSSKEREYVAQWEDQSVDTDRFILYPQGGEACIRCPRFGKCKRSKEDAFDGR